MIIRAVFDAFTPTWAAYGRIVFVEVDSDIDALRGSIEAAQAQYPDSRIVIREFEPSTPEARARHNEHQEQIKRWMANVAAGVPNVTTRRTKQQQPGAVQPSGPKGKSEAGERQQENGR